MREILLVTKGHPYEREPFYAVFDEMADLNWTLVEQPAAQAMFNVEQAQNYDAYVMYDMPGIQFQPDGPPIFAVPSARYKEDFLELLAHGHGFVFLHHAIAGWPAWPEYAEIIGGRFLYMPAELHGVACQDSGYRHGVTHTVNVNQSHPIAAGLDAQFEITDELYLYEVFSDQVEPLLTSQHEFVADNFYSAARVVRDGKMFDNEGWEHEPGSNLIGWSKTYGNSRIVYLQCGDDAAAYASLDYRRLLSNAIEWVSDLG